MRKMKQRKKSKNRTGKICISCMVVVLTLIMSVQIGHLYQVNEGYKQDEKTKQAQLKDEQERSTELQEKEAYVGSDQYIVDTAKSKLGMTYPDEIVVFIQVIIFDNCNQTISIRRIGSIACFH